VTRSGSISDSNSEALALRTRRASLRKRLALRGYTAIEVLISLSVFAVGAAGVIGMLRSSVQGNMDARKLDVANSIARTWMERLRRASMTWTLPGASNPTTNLNAPNNDAATLLGATRVNTTATPNWFVPNNGALSADNLEGNSAAFDLLGRDLPDGEWDTATDGTSQSNAVFCTHVRLDCAVPNPNAGGAGCPLIRATVRVFWPRKLSGAPPLDFCRPGRVAEVEANGANLYHFVYLTSAIRQNAIQ